MALKGEPASLQLPRSCHFGSLAILLSASHCRAGVAGDAVAKYLDRKGRTRIVASQELAEIGEIPESPNTPDPR